MSSSSLLHNHNVNQTINGLQEEPGMNAGWNKQVWASCKKLKIFVLYSKISKQKRDLGTISFFFLWNKPAAFMGPILSPGSLLFLLLLSLRMRLNRTEFCLSFIQHLKAFQPISSHRWRSNAAWISTQLSHRLCIHLKPIDNFLSKQGISNQSLEHPLKIQ